MESGEYFADVGDTDFALNRCFAIRFVSLPEAIASQVTKRQIGIVLVVVFFHQEKSCGEAVAQFLAPGNVVRLGLSFIDQIQCREEQKRLVGLFVGAAFFDWRRADAERVEALDGLVNRWKGWFDFLEGLVRRLLTEQTRSVEENSPETLKI